MGAGSFFKVLLSSIGMLAGPVVSLGYPLYASVRAIETKSPVDDRQWLTYWVLYSLFTLFELTFSPVIKWIPLWSYAKLLLNCWLVLPQFTGATYVYDHIVRPALMNQRIVNMWLSSKKSLRSSGSDDARSAAGRPSQDKSSKASKSQGSKKINTSLLEELEAAQRAYGSKTWDGFPIFEEDH